MVPMTPGSATGGHGTSPRIRQCFFFFKKMFFYLHQAILKMQFKHLFYDLLTKRFLVPNSHFLREFTVTIFRKHLRGITKPVICVNNNKKQQISILVTERCALIGYKWMSRGQSVYVYVNKKRGSVPGSLLIFLRIGDFLGRRMFLYSEAPLLTSSYGTKATASQSAGLILWKIIQHTHKKFLLLFISIRTEDRISIDIASQFALVETNCVQTNYN